MGDKHFGTDGIRARAGEFPLDRTSTAALGAALVRLLRAKDLDPLIIVGRDTRESGAWMEGMLMSGVRQAGGTLLAAGVIPTSAVSFLTRKHGCSAGVVISASHNPFRDNGIKIFSHEGLKIPDDWEAELEAAIEEARRRRAPEPLAVEPDHRFADDYAAYLESRVAIGRRGAGRLRIVLDCANGAGSVLGPRVFREFGFDVVTLNCAPDGTNINRGCGSLHPEALAGAVVGSAADLGVAFDGDADRALWADRGGRILTGDHTLYVLGLHMKAAGRLRTDEIVATTMSNMALELAFADAGVRLVRTRVGDKYVRDEMDARGANLGGERSGHTIFLDDMPTGDGLLTALKMVEVMTAEERPLVVLVQDYREFPQVLVNVEVARKPDFDEIPGLRDAEAETRRKLEGHGRLDLRYSGTEPLARIMIEGDDAAEVETLAQGLAAIIDRHIGRRH